MREHASVFAPLVNTPNPGSPMRFRLSLATFLFSTLAFATSFGAEEKTGAAAYSSGVTTKILLQTQTDGAGAKLVYPTNAPAEVTAVFVEVAPGRQTNWHRHPVPCFAYMLEGELTVETADGEKKVFKAGDALAEVVDILHNGINAGPAPVRLVLFVIGTVGQPFAIRTQTP
jgi:Uncharacterized conserved protein, contains double-stranded beta-helix domain